jgi:hypothetical protein
MSVIHRLTILLLLFSLFITADGQTGNKEAEPYKVVISGKQLTVKSKKNIKHVMLWTSSGHRVVEQREINAESFTFAIPVYEKIFFLMIGLYGGRIYTVKIGLE